MLAAGGKDERGKGAEDEGGSVLIHCYSACFVILLIASEKDSAPFLSGRDMSCTTNKANPRCPADGERFSNKPPFCYRCEASSCPRYLAKNAKSNA